MRSFWVVSLLLLLSFTALHAFAQDRRIPTNPFPPSHQAEPEDEMRARREKELVKKANADRQQQLKRDTANLLKLATELQQYVDKTNENMLSVEVLKKADEIEKLAHSVKEKMRGDQ